MALADSPRHMRTTPLAFQLAAEFGFRTSARSMYAAPASTSLARKVRLRPPDHSAVGSSLPTATARRASLTASAISLSRSTIQPWLLLSAPDHDAIAQEVVVSIEALGRLPSRTLDLRALEPWLNGSHHLCGHLILQVKYVLQGTIEAVCPNVAAGCRVDEL